MKIQKISKWVINFFLGRIGNKIIDNKNAIIAIITGTTGSIIYTIIKEMKTISLILIMIAVITFLIMILSAIRKRMMKKRIKEIIQFKYVELMFKLLKHIITVKIDSSELLSNPATFDTEQYKFFEVFT